MLKLLLLLLLLLLGQTLLLVSGILCDCLSIELHLGLYLLWSLTSRLRVMTSWGLRLGSHLRRGYLLCVLTMIAGLRWRMLHCYLM